MENCIIIFPLCSSWLSLLRVFKNWLAFLNKLSLPIITAEAAMFCRKLKLRLELAQWISLSLSCAWKNNEKNCFYWSLIRWFTMKVKWTLVIGCWACHAKTLNICSNWSAFFFFYEQEKRQNSPQWLGKRQKKSSKEWQLFWK